MNKETIAIDLDSTTWNVMNEFIPLYNKTYNTNVKEEDIDKWYFFPEDRFYIIYNQIVKNLYKFKPMDNFIGLYINTLGCYYDLYFLTHGNYSQEDIEKKLAIWGIYKGITYKNIIITKKRKVDFTFDYFIDDNPYMVKEIQEYQNKKLFLYLTAWNKNVKNNGYKNVFVVNSWNEIVEKLVCNNGRNR